MDELKTEFTTRRKLLATTGSAALLGVAGCTSDSDDDDNSDDQDSEADTDNEANDTDESNQDQSSESSVTLLVEQISAGHEDHEGEGEDEHNHEEEGEHEDHEGEGEDEHNHEEEGEHNQEGESEDEHNHEGEGEHDHGGGEDHDYATEGLTSSEIGHACNHLEEVAEFGAEDVAGAQSTEEAPQLDQTHHPYNVTFDGESGHVSFHMAGNHEDEGEDDHNHEDAEMLAFFTEGGSADVVHGNLMYRESSEVEACGPMDRYVLVEPEDGEAVVSLSTL